MGSKDKSEDLPPPHPMKLKVLTTIAILAGNITFGCAFNFFNPAVDDFRVKYDTTVDEVSFVFTIMLIGYCMGALSTAVIYNYVPRQLGAIFWHSVMAAALFVAPHCGSLGLLYMIGAFLGFSAGAYDSTQVVWTVEIWQEKVGPILQTQHFCYALGTNIPPLLLGPFLIEEEEDDIVTSVTKPPESQEESKIFIPFSIGGSFSALACLLQILLFLFYRYYKPPMYQEALPETIRAEEPMKDEKQTNILSYIRSIFKMSPQKFRLIVVTGIFLGAYQGMEMTTFQLFSTFGQYSDLKLSESDAAYVLSGVTGAFAVGRFIGIFLILKLHPVILLYGNLLLILMGALTLLIWAQQTTTMLWVAGILLGGGFSTVYASFSGFMEKNLVFTNGIGAFMLVCGSTVAAIYPVVVGENVETNAAVLTYPIFLSLACCIGSLTVGYFLTRKSKVRY